MNSLQNNIGAYVYAINAVAPQAPASAATINGATIDRDNYNSAVVLVQTGAATGTPATLSIASKIQDSADGSAWADVAGLTGTAITAVQSETRIPLNLTPLRRYFRVVLTTTYTGGTSPTVFVASSSTLGGAIKKPVPA